LLWINDLRKMVAQFLKFLLENQKGRDHSGNLGVDGNNVRMDVREIGWEFVDWMHQAQDRNQWRALVNTAMNFWVP
jgi:hypothetical protein